MDKTLSTLSPSERAGICADFVEGVPVSEICTKYEISDRTFRLIKAKDNLDRARQSAIAAARSAEIKAAQDIVVLDAKAAVYKTTKEGLKLLLDDLLALYFESRKNPLFKPKSVEGLANAIQKVADTMGRLTDDDQMAAQEIEIRITGVPPATALTPADAVESFVIEQPHTDPPSDPPQLGDGGGLQQPGT